MAVAPTLQCHVLRMCSCLQVDSEEPVFEAVINWVKHSKKEREASLPELLQYVRMPLLTPRYITDVIDTEVPAFTACSCLGSTSP